MQYHDTVLRTQSSSRILKADFLVKRVSYKLKEPVHQSIVLINECYIDYSAISKNSDRLVSKQWVPNYNHKSLGFPTAYRQKQ